MNAIVEHINSVGFSFVEFAVPMLVQSGILIVILLLADLLLRKRVKAVFRYWIWMLVLVKLVLPTSLSSPLSLGYFFGDKLTYQDLSQSSPTLEPTVPTPADVSSSVGSIYIQPNPYIPPSKPVTSIVEPVIAEPAGPPEAPVTPLSWQGVVFLVWLAVVIAMGLLLLQRALFVRGLVAQAKKAGRLMNDELAYCCASMRMRCKVGLKVSVNATTPSVCGLIRPVILVPWNLTSTLGVSRMRTVLMHELAHIRRADLWVNLAQTVLQIIYFYNPLLWLANCVIRRVREQAVDEAVLVAMGTKAQRYPQTLVDVAKLAFKRPALSLRLIGVVESKSALAGRIKHILGRPMPRSAKLGIVGVLAVIIAGAILLPMARASRSVVLTVAADGSAEYSSIQEAIDAASIGAVVRIAPGVYEEQIKIGKPLTLEGAGWDKTTVTVENNVADVYEEVFDMMQKEFAHVAMKKMQDAKTEEERKAIEAEFETEFKAKFKDKFDIQAVLVSDTKDVVIRGLKISYPGRHIEGRLISVPIVRFSNAEAKMSGCVLAGSPGDGIHVMDGSDLEIRNCLVGGLWNTGIVVGQDGGAASRMRILDSDVRNCYYAGIWIRAGNEPAEIKRCRVSGAAWHGIVYSGNSPTIEDNAVFGNARIGIGASYNAAGIVRRNIIYGNEIGGMSCSYGSRPVIEGNTFADNKESGLRIFNTAKPIVRKNIFVGNPTAVFCGDFGGDEPSVWFDGVVTLENNLFWDSEDKAIWQNIATEEQELKVEDISLDKEAGNIEVDPLFSNVRGKDFSLSANSTALRSGIGVAEPLAFYSPWPLQEEELAIIPEGDTRNYQHWKHQDESTPMAEAEKDADVQAVSLDHFVGRYAVAGHPDTAAFEITKKGDVFIFSGLDVPKFEMDLFLRGLEGRKFEMKKGRDNLKFGSNPRERYRVRYNAAEASYILDSLGMRGEVQDATSFQLAELIKISTEKPGDTFSATLPNGVTVELVGLFRGKTKETLTWWLPDGNEITKGEFASYTRKIRDKWIRDTDFWRFEYGYALKLTPSEDVSVGTSATVGQTTHNSPATGGKCVAIIESDETMRESGLADMGEVIVSVAYGVWRGFGGQKSTGSTDIYHLENGSKILISDLLPSRTRPESMSSVVVTDDSPNDIEIRVICELKDGRIKEAWKLSSIGARRTTRGSSFVQAMFDIPAKMQDIKSLWVEYRPCYKLRFKNVSLRPGRKTDVQVEVEESEPVFVEAIEAGKTGVSLPVRKILSRKIDKGGSFEWETTIDPRVRFRHGWYTVEDGAVREHVGGGSQILEESELNLKLDVEVKDNMLNLKVQRVHDSADGSRTEAVASKTPVPAGAHLKHVSSVDSAVLTNNHLTLWQGDFIRDGKVVKSVIYAAYLTTPDDPETGFKPPVLQKAEFVTSEVKPDAWPGIDSNVSPKLVMLLDAINSCAAETDLNIDSVSITDRNISIKGDTSDRTNTRKFLDAIKDNGLNVSSLRLLNAKDNRDKFSIVVEPKQDWQQWWQQRKIDVQLEAEQTISPKLIMLLVAIKSVVVEIDLNIESISITAKSMNIEGDTSRRTDTLKFLDAIKDNGLQVSRLNLDERNNRDRFRITVEPKEGWQQWWQKHKTDVHAEVPAKEDVVSKPPQPELLSAKPPIVAYDVKLNFADPTVRDGSFHSEQSVAFSLSFHNIEILPADKFLASHLLIGQTTWAVLLEDNGITIQEGVAGQKIRSVTWPAGESKFEKVIKIPLKYGQKEYSCPVRVELDRRNKESPTGSYWFCAYLSGRLPWGAGGRGFEIVNLDQQMEFRLTGDGTNPRDAVLGIDIDGDGRIDPAKEGGEQFDLYEPFQIGPKTYRLAEVDPYLPRVVFRELDSLNLLNPPAKTDVPVEEEKGSSEIAEGAPIYKKTIRFTAVVTKIIEFNPSGNHDTFAVEDDPRFILFLQVTAADPQNYWFKTGRDVDFLIHDPVVLFGGEQKEVVGKSYYFVMERHEFVMGQDMERRFTLHSVRPLAAKPKPDVLVEVEQGDESAESKTTVPKAQEPVKQRGGISGVVVNSVTGQPIAGAYVGVGDFGDSGGSNYSRHREQGFHDKTKTDAEGRFELNGLVFTDKSRDLEYHPLVVTHPDFVRHDERIELLSGGPIPDVKVSLRPAAKIEVIIVDADGNTLEGQWLLRLEALDGRRFIPPGSDPHLSSFASNIWAHWPDLRTNMGVSNGFTFTELDSGRYLIEAIRIRLVDKPTPQSIWKPTITYHGSIPSLEIEAGQSKQVKLAPQDHQTQLTITAPEFPDKLFDKLERSSQMPLMCLISRSPGALLWDDGKIRHLEDQRLGRIDKKRFFRGFFSQNQPLIINNLPPDSYSLFTMAVYGQVAGYLIGARADLAKGDNITVDIPWRQPTGPSMFGPNRSFDYPVKLEARDYSVSKLCGILTEITQSNPRIVADSSIENEKLSFGKSQMSVWDVLEKLYLDKGWTVDEVQEKTLIIKPAKQINMTVEGEGAAEAKIERLRETEARRAIAEKLKERVEFLDLDLTDAPRTTESADLPDLFEARPLGSKSYHRREDIDIVYSGLDGKVYYIPEKEIFYIQHDKLGSSTLTYYGPFNGDPHQVLDLEKDMPIRAEQAEASSGEIEVAANKDVPGITFESLVCDLGQIPPRTKHVCEFKFTNTGNEVLKITSIRSACACAASKLKKKEYAPGESETLKVTYQSAAHAGRVTKHVYVYSNDKVNPKLTLTIKAEIVVKVVHEPKRLNILLKGENAGCPAIKLASIDNQPFSITGFKSTGDSIAAEFNSSVKETSFVIQPKVDMEKLRKGLRGQINVSLTHPECKKVTIIFDTLAEFKADPRVVYVRNAEPLKPVTKKVWIRSNYNEDVEVESTSSKKGTVKVLTQEKVRNRHLFELQIIPPAQESNKRVFTDVFTVVLKGGQQIQITCYGIYSKKPAKTAVESGPGTDTQSDIEEAGEKFSQLMGADLPASVQNIKFLSGSFEAASKTWTRFDMPLSDLKNLLAESDMLPDFSDLHKNPRIQKGMDAVSGDFNVEWWKSDELENPVCAAWIKSNRIKGNPEVWMVHILNICCSQLNNNLMRVYISLYSDSPYGIPMINPDMEREIEDPQVWSQELAGDVFDALRANDNSKLKALIADEGRFSELQEYRRDYDFSGLKKMVHYQKADRCFVIVSPIRHKEMRDSDLEIQISFQLEQNAWKAHSIDTAGIGAMDDLLKEEGFKVFSEIEMTREFPDTTTPSSANNSTLQVEMLVDKQAEVSLV